MNDLERYSVVVFGPDQRVIQLVEKPKRPHSSFEVTGLYFVDGTVRKRARATKHSTRGEVEIVDLLTSYIEVGMLTLKRMGREIARLDRGIHCRRPDAGNFVRTLQARQCLQTGCPEKIAFRNGRIPRDGLRELAQTLVTSEHVRHLLAGARSGVDAA